jgi:hypothetical protein
MFKIGDEIVWGDIDKVSSLREGTITKIGIDFCWVDNYHKSEDCIYQAYCWPKKYKEELENIITKRVALKKAYDDSMALIYELRNKIVREQKE